MKNSTELRGHTAGIEHVAWNPTKEAELASVSGDGTCKFWDVRSKGCVETVQLGGGGLTLAWADDGSVVMVGRKVRSALAGRNPSIWNDRRRIHGPLRPISSTLTPDTC